MAFLAPPSRCLALLCALLLALLPAPARADAPRRHIFTNSVLPIPPDLAPAIKPLQQQHLAETQEIEVPLKMRDYPKLIERIGHGETVTQADLDRDHLPFVRDYELVERWLDAQGFEITQRDPNRLSIFVRGTLAQIQSTFQVQMVKVTVGGKTFNAAQTHPSLPANIAAPVLGINGLQPFLRPHRHTVHLNPQINNQPPYLAKEILGAYNGTSLGVTGANQTIAILIDTVPLDSDLTNFWTKNGVSQSLSNITKIPVNASTTTNDDDGEATLDVEWSSSIAPSAKIRIYATGDLSFTDIDKGLQRVIADLPNQPTLHQLSISLGLGEKYLAGSSETTTEAQFFSTLAAKGVTVFVASGDAGSNPASDGQSSNGSLQVEYEASDPSVTGVGGTNLTLNSSGAVSTETAWSGSGGGASIDFSRPSWQKGTGVPSGTMRLVPDVALVASVSTPAYLYFQGQAEQVAGTSWATPTWAGFAALINEARANNSLSSLGLLNPLIYPLIGTTNFRDIVSGSNGAYSAGTGYDRVTGIGVPNLAVLLQTLGGAASSTPSIASFTPASGRTGSTVTITGTNFDRVTGVQFNNGVTATFSEDSATQITATVPANATTGPITLVSASGNTTSANNFTVLATIANDNFASATGISGASGTISGTNSGATKETGEPNHAGNAGGASVWYSWTAPANGVFTFTTAGSSFDTLLGVYTGTTVSNLTAIASNDDAGTGVTSAVSFVAASGTVYKIAVDGHDGQSGSLTLAWSQNTAAPSINSFTPTTGSAGTLVVINGANFTGATGVQFNGVAAASFTVNSTTQVSATVPVGASTGVITLATPNGTATSAAVFTVVNPPANDNFANAQSITGETGSVTGTNLAATKEPGEPNHAGDTGGHSVWYTWTAPSTKPITFNTFGSSFDTLLAIYTGSAVNQLTQVAADQDAGAGISSAVTFNAVSGTIYHIAIDGSGGVAGNLVLNWTTDISGPEITSFSPTAGPIGSQVVISGNGFASATSVAFNGTPATFSVNSRSQLTATVPAGATIGPISVTNPAGTVSSLATFTVNGPPANDNFANATTITGTGAVTGRNDGATKETGEPDHAGDTGGASVWWNWTATMSGQVTITTLGSTFDTTLAVYTGSAVNALSLIASNDDDPSGGHTSAVTFNAVSGTLYHIAVDGFGGVTGQIVLSIIPDAAGNIFSTGFETSESYVLTHPSGAEVTPTGTVKTLAGQKGWVATQGNGGNGTITNFFQGLGQQGFIGGKTLPRGTTGTVISQPLSYSPRSGDIVSFEVTMQIVDSTNHSYDDFGWTVTNRAGQSLFRLDFDNNALAIGYTLDDGRGIRFTSYGFDNQSVYVLLITMDFTNNTWTASVDGQSILDSPQPITTTGATLDLGGIGATWDLLGRGGNNYMVFDNYTVRNTGNTPPGILLAPQSQTVSAGSDVTLRAVANGSQPLTYQWQKGAAAIPGATSSTYQIPNAQIGDSGSYSVVVTNSVSAITSTAANVQVENVVAPNLEPSGLGVSTSADGSSPTLRVTNTDNLFVSYSIANAGTAVAPASFTNALYVDGVLQDTYVQSTDLNPGDSATHAGVSIGSLGIGTHTIQVAVDTNNDVGEFNEGDNTASQTITVVDAATSAKIVASVTPVGSGTVTGTGTYTNGSAVTLTATPATGYTFVKWLDGTTTASTSASYTFTASGNRTLVALFALTADLPTIAITSPAGATASTIQTTISLAGTAGGTSAITAVTWTSDRGGSGQATGNEEWSIPSVPLVSGTNVITVTALNANGLTSSTTVTISHDALSAFKGTYIGLLDTSASTPAYFGQAKFTLTATGAFTASIWFEGRNSVITGKFLADGTFSKTIARGKNPSLSLTATLNADASPNISGTVTDGTTAGIFQAVLPGYSAKVPWPHKGRYTLLLAPDPSNSSAPTGYGYGLVSVDAKGTVTLTGKLADGTAIAHAAPLTAGNVFPLYTALYTNGGYLAGPATFTADSTGDISGVADWIRPAIPAAGRFRPGFTNRLTLQGSGYSPLAIPTLATGTRSVEIGDGDLGSDTLSKTATLNNAGALSLVPSTDKSVHLSVTRATGHLTGTFTDPTTGATTVLQGAVLQDIDTGGGYFLSPGGSGYLDLGSVSDSQQLVAPSKESNPQK